MNDTHSQGGSGGPQGRSPMMRGLRRGLLLVVVILAAAGAVLAVRWLTSDEMLRNPATEIHADFTLTDQDGGTVTAADLAGKPMLLYFGYTYCPDVCPTELANITQVMDLLGDAAAQVQPVFITVDPERDTRDVMKSYLGHFHDSFIGLTGSAEQVAQAARAAKVYYAKVEMPDSSVGYLMDHTGFVYLLDADGRYLAHFRPNTDPQEMADRVKAIL